VIYQAIQAMRRHAERLRANHQQVLACELELFADELHAEATREPTADLVEVLCPHCRGVVTVQQRRPH